jgi:hypothetical protein
MRAFVVDKPQTGALRALNYTPAVERIRRAGSSSARSLREVVKEFGPAYGTVFTRADCRLDQGVELLSQSDMFAAEPRGRSIRRDSMREPEKHLIEAGQVLIAGAGTLGENELYGRAILSDARLEGKYVGPDSMTLVFEDPDDDFSLFTYAWLASPTGVQAIRSTSYGTKILRFREALLSTLPIPAAPSGVTTRVASLVRRCVAGREKYGRAINESRRLVEGNASMVAVLEACSSRSRRSIVWAGPLPSLCAWNFAAGGGAVRLLRDHWRTSLCDVIEPNGIFNGPRFARVDCSLPHGIDFLSQRDVFLMRAVGRRIARPLISDRMLFVPKNALLVGSHGQMTEGSIFGKVELASFAGWRSGVTQDILRMLVRDGLREVAYAFLSTSVGQWLLKSTAVGTSIPSMRIDLLERLPFPDPGAVPSDEIKRLVLAGETARIDADEAEAEAIRIIEKEVLPQWLA